MLGPVGYSRDDLCPAHICSLSGPESSTSPGPSQAPSAAAAAVMRWWGLATLQWRGSGSTLSIPDGQWILWATPVRTLPVDSAGLCAALRARYLIHIFLEICHFFLEILRTFTGVFLRLLRFEYSISRSYPKNVPTVFLKIGVSEA